MRLVGTMASWTRLVLSSFSRLPAPYANGCCLALVAACSSSAPSPPGGGGAAAGEGPNSSGPLGGDPQETVGAGNGDSQGREPDVAPSGGGTAPLPADPNGAAPGGDQSMPGSLPGDPQPPLSSGPIEAPEAVEDAFSFPRGSTYQVGAPGFALNDIGRGGSLVAATSTTERGGAVTLTADGGFEYVPRSDRFWGDDSFEYTLSNEAGSSTAKVFLSIQPPTEIQLADLEIGGNGFAIQANVLDGFAAAVADAGDVNGDGFDDVLIGVPDATVDGVDDAGAAFVVFGGPSVRAISFPLTALNSTLGIRIGGNSSGEQLGASVAGVGDINGDGFDDMVIGAPQSDTGGAYVVYGSADPSDLSLSQVANGSAGYPIVGEESDDQAGAVVARAGDVNGDGRPDILVSALDRVLADDFGSTTYVVYGQQSPTGVQLGSLSAQTGFRIDSFEGLESVRSNVAAAGAQDFNGDGFDDVVVAGGGRLAVVFGAATNTPLSIENFPAGRGVLLTASNDYALLESKVAGVGDTNGDGLADVLLTAGQLNQDEDPDLRGAYVLLGRRSAASLSLDSLEASGGYKLAMADLFAECSEATFSAGGGGDTNGDGLADLFFAMWPEGTCGSEVLRRAFSVRGNADATGASLSGLTALAGNTLVGPNDRSVNEAFVSTAGDVNGDGLADRVILEQGSVYVLYGWTTDPATRAN